MPCDTVNVMTVDLGNVDRTELDAAMDTLYAGMPYSLTARGQLNIQGRVFDSEAEIISKVKRQITKQVVTKQAKRFGWSVKENENGTLRLIKARL